MRQPAQHHAVAAAGIQGTHGPLLPGVMAKLAKLGTNVSRMGHAGQMRLLSSLQRTHGNAFVQRVVRQAVDTPSPTFGAAELCVQRQTRPTPTPLPATVPTPSPTDFRIDRVGASTTERIFFARNA
ncbi:MAG: hypothetical protein KJZ93_23310, partial [Caldilineaceae bacterium]|nr:hypothetical protein [Caldilineaceae bacterium]